MVVHRKPELSLKVRMQSPVNTHAVARRNASRRGLVSAWDKAMVIERTFHGGRKRFAGTTADLMRHQAEMPSTFRLRCGRAPSIGGAARRDETP
jgi:hypothetical protein